ncbi:MAG: hypothetical protein D6780_05355, partial [Candidatus Dadabacteria bacterium]
DQESVINPSDLTSQSSPLRMLRIVRGTDSSLRTQLNIPENNLITVVSGIEPYPKEAINLFAKYFQGTLLPNESIDLASKLIFPFNRDAAELYKSYRKGDKVNEDLLNAYCLAGGNKEIFQLYKKKLVEGHPLTPEEIIKLHSYQAFPNSPKRAAVYREEIDRVVAKASTFQEKKEGILKLVLAGIEKNTPPISVAELSVLFRLPRKAVRQIIHQELSPAQLLRYRERNLLMHYDTAKAFRLRILQAVRNFLSIENEMYKAGAARRLSTDKQLASLLGVSPTYIRHCLQFAYKTDRNFRLAKLRSTVFQGIKDEITDRVQREIKKYKRSIRGRENLSTEEQLANEYGLLPITVYHILKEGLSADDFSARQLALYEMNKLPEFLQSPRAFVREELLAFQRGEIEWIHTDEELSKLFTATPASIRIALSPFNGGLTHSEFKSREFILALAKPAPAPAEALRLEIVELIKERVLRKTEEIDLGRDRSKVKFDSYEEAACAILLERYVPGFRAEEGKTLHIPVGKGFIDFKVGDFLIEYHPIKAYWTKDGTGDFENYFEYDQFNKIKKALGKISATRKRAYIERVKNALLAEYRKQRERLIKNDPVYAGTTLLIATSPEEFYHIVIKALGRNVPDKKSFIREFRRLAAMAKASRLKRD